jgi:hypothetical protein
MLSHTSTIFTACAGRVSYFANIDSERHLRLFVTAISLAHSSSYQLASPLLETQLSSSS